MNARSKPYSPEWYASDFMKQLRLGMEVEQKCERSCLLWSKEHWAAEAKRAQLNLQHSREQTKASSTSSHLRSIYLNAQFLNTVAQVYGKMFGFANESCAAKDFTKCPHFARRNELLRTGSLASLFVTILHKATMSAMLERHGVDGGLFDDEYDNVYETDLTNFQDLEASLEDGRFGALYDEVLKRAKQLAGIPCGRPKNHRETPRFLTND